MDLQAILDASSSSSSDRFPNDYTNYTQNNFKPAAPDSYDDGLSDISSALNDDSSSGIPNGSSSFRDSYRYTSNSFDSEDLITNITKGTGRRCNNMELERILRDDDDDNEEDKDDANAFNYTNKKDGTRHIGKDTDILHSILNEEDDENSRDEDETFAKCSTRQTDMAIYSTLDNNSSFGVPTAAELPLIPISHSMEVDAILDSVADDDNEENYNDLNSSYLKCHRRMLSANANSDDEDDDDGIGLNFNFSKGLRHQNNIAYENMSTQYPLTRGMPAHEEEHYGKVHIRGKSTPVGEDSLKDYTASFLHRHNTKTSEKEVSTRDTTDQLAAPVSEDQQNEQISDLCLQSAELFEHRLLKSNNRNIISPLTVKRRMKPKVALKSKSRMSQGSKSTQQPQSQPRFEFSGGIIQVKSMADLGTQILKSNAQQTDLYQRENLHGGFPTTMAVNSKFIAVGTQRGEIWIFDLFEQLKLTLGTEETTTGIGDNKKTHSVTSIDLPIHGDYLLAGYGSGAIILWDVIKGVVLKGIFDLHSSPITSVRLTAFPIAQNGGNDRDIAAVSVDASGLVSKIVFSRGMLWSSYSAETECLLDGTAGQILAIDTLPPLDTMQYSEGAMEYHPSAYKIVLIAMSSDRSSFAVSVFPKVSVLHRWAKPAPDRIDPNAVEIVDDCVSDITMSYAPTFVSVDQRKERLTFLPCLSWGWGLVSGGKNSVTPILARSWGCCIQFLCAKFPPREEDDTQEDDGTIHWPAFGLHDEFDASAPVVSLNWLGARSLVYLTLSNEFTIIDTVIMTMQERLDFKGIKLVYAEFALSRPKSKESDLCTTFMNSIRSNDNRLLVLCEDEVKQITVMGITQQISSLEEGGQWLEALALALDHYESTIQSQEDRQRDTRGTMTHTDISLLTEEEIWMAELLMRYLLLAIDNAPEPELISSNKRLNLAQTHFEMLSGVCLEYCVTMKRLDLLFGPIFRCFYEARYINVFLDIMQTYILNDRLRYIAPEVMVLFVAHCKDIKDISMVERCLLHMDCTLMDFDSILALLKKNALYTGLLHVYSTGLADYVSPLEVLFEAIFDSLDNANVIHGNRRKEGILTSDFEKYGFKGKLMRYFIYFSMERGILTESSSTAFFDSLDNANVTALYSFSGKGFPRGDNTISNERIHTLRAEIFELLFREVVVTTHRQAFGTAHKRAHGVRSSSYPYIRSLILVDAKALLDCLAIVLDDKTATFDEAANNMDVMGSWDVEYGTDNDRVSSVLAPSLSFEKDPKLLPDRQILVNILSSIFMTDDVVTFDNHFSVREPSQVTENVQYSFLDFLAKYLELGVFTAPRYLTAEVMKRLCSKGMGGTSEDDVLSLLKALPRSSYDLDEILSTIEMTHMTRAALFLYMQGVSRSIDRPSMSDKCQNYFNRTIDCFLKDDDFAYRKGLFEYATKQCAGGCGTVATDDGNSTFLLRRVLLKRIAELIALDGVQTARLVGELFVEDIDMILSSIQSTDSGRVQYAFLHAIVADLPKVDPVAAQELGANLTNEHRHRYLALMTRFQPDMVYSYLSTNQNYRLEDALKLCQDRRLTDGSAYLLERMGDISGALVLMLQTLDTRMIGLKSIIQESMIGTSLSRSRVSTVSAVKARLQNNEAAQKELAGAKLTLSAALDLCERNKNDHLIIENARGPLLWFHVLDKLVNAKHLLGASKKSTEYHLIAISTVLSDLLLMTMQRMTHHVSHYDLMQKVTVDHAGSTLGEFREMLVSMLKTYSSELDVCSNAVKVMQHDIRSLSVQRKNMKVRGSFILECPRPLSKKAILDIHPSGGFRHTKSRHGSYNERFLQVNSSMSLRQRRKNEFQHGMRLGRRRSKRDNAPNFMTASERHYSTGGDLSNAAYSFDDGGVRQVGALSEAQNVGGL